MLPPRQTLRTVLLGVSFLACSSGVTEPRNEGGGGGAAAASDQGRGGRNAPDSGGGGPTNDAGSNAGAEVGGANVGGTDLGSETGGVGGSSQDGAGGSRSGLGGSGVGGNRSGGAPVGGRGNEASGHGVSGNEASGYGASGNEASGHGASGNRGGGEGGAGGSGGSSGIANRGGSHAGGASGTGGAPADTGLPSKCSGTCNAATPANAQMTAYGALGNITVYTTSASDGGACNYGATKVMYFAAIETRAEWDGGKMCGQCLEVTVLTSQGWKSTVVRVMDKCPDDNCGVDLGGSSSSEVMADGAGRYQGAWRKVSCTGQAGVSDGAPSLHVKDGASRGWSIVQIRNPSAAVTSIDYQDASNPAYGGTLDWSKDAENYLAIPASILQEDASYLLTIRYSDGSTGTVTLSSTQLATPSASYPLD